MDLKMKSLCTLGVAIALLAGGCGGEGGAAGGGSAAPAAGSDDHEHAEEGHEGHEGHDHGPGEHDEHEADLRSLGTVEVGGSTLAVSIGGDLQPGAELHVEVELSSGSAPSAVRAWVGRASGVGSLKSKLDRHDGHFHGHTEVPQELGADAALWIEVEDAEGKRTPASLPLR